MKIFSSALSLLIAILIFAGGAQAASICAGLFREAEPTLRAHDQGVISGLQAILDGKAKSAGPRPETLEAYIKRAEERSRHVKLPTFRHPETDIQASKTWGAVEAPKFFQGLLPKGVGAISHSLYAAMAPGVVKVDGGGAYVPLRSSVDFTRASGKVEKIETNVGINVNALIANAGKPVESRYLVSDKSEAVYIALHGGGTKGTGHHTAVEKINFFGASNVGVISLDLPWHAEGPRQVFTGPEEFARYLGAFLRQNVPPHLLKKKVVIEGHSLGGQWVEMLMRLSDRKDLELNDMVALYVPLSTVADPAPGQSVRERFRAAVEREKLQREKHWDNVAEGDRELTHGLIADDKIAPSTAIAYTVFGLAQDWKMPDHQGANYIPTLAVSGRGDFTYVGYQDLYQKYFHSLKNVTSLVIGRRETHYSLKEHARDPSKPKDELIGHLIQDSNKPETLPPEVLANPELVELYNNIKPGEKEVYGLIRAEMEKILGKKFDRLPIPTGDDALVSQFVADWFRKTAFREFVQDYNYFKVVSMSPFVDAKRDIKAIKKNKAIPDAEKQKQVADRLARLSQESGRNIKTIEELDAVAIENVDILNHRYIPDGPMRERAIQNLAARKKIEELQNAAAEAKKAALLVLRGRSKRGNEPEIEGLNKKRKQTEKAIASEIVKPETIALSPIYSAKVAETAAAMKKQADLDAKLRELADEFYVSLHERGAMTEENLSNWTPEMRATATAYTEAAQAAQNLKKELAQLAEQEALAGNLGVNAHHLYQTLVRLRSEMDTAQKTVNDAEYVGHKATIEHFRLLEEYVTQIVPGNYQVRQSSLKDVVDRDFAEWRNHIWIMQQGWGRWGNLWGERPPPEKMDLY